MQFSDEIYQKIYPGWGRTEAEADFRATGGSKWTDYQHRQSPQFIQQQQAEQNKAAQQAAQQKLMEETRAREGAFVNKLSGVPDALRAIEGEVGLPEARQTYQSAGEKAQTVANMMRDIAPAQQTLSKQFGISAPRLQQRISAKRQELAPQQESAARDLESAGFALQGVLGNYQTKAQNVIRPMEIEAGMLGESFARDFDLFKSNINADLQRELSQLSNMNAIQLQELANSGALDRIEKQAQAEKALADRSYQALDLGNRYALVDSQGNEIGSFAKGKLGGSGTSNIDQYLFGQSIRPSSSGFELKTLFDNMVGGFSNVNPDALQYMTFK